MKKHEWSDEASLILEDAVADGFPASAICKRLGVTQAAVYRRASALGLKLSRGGLVSQTTLHIRKDAHAKLTAIAQARNVGFGVLARLILELAAGSPAYIDSLLDDLDRHLDRPDAPLTPQKSVDISEAVPVPPAAVPLAMLLQPMLQGHMS